MNANHETEQFSAYTSKSYLKNITDRYGRLLTHQNIKTSFKTTQQIRVMLRLAEKRHFLARNHKTLPSCQVAHFGTLRKSENLC